MELWCRPFWLQSTRMLLLLTATASRMLPLPPPAGNPQLYIHTCLVSRFTIDDESLQAFGGSFLPRILQGIEFLKDVLYGRCHAVLASR